MPQIREYERREHEAWVRYMDAVRGEGLYGPQHSAVHVSWTKSEYDLAVAELKKARDRRALMDQAKLSRSDRKKLQRG